MSVAIWIWRCPMRSVRVRKHKNGTVTLAGISADELRSLHIGAFLHAHVRLKEDPAPDVQAYYTSVLLMAKAVGDAMMPERTSPLTISERWSKVRFAQKLRRFIDEAVAKRVEERAALERMLEEAP